VLRAAGWALAIWVVVFWRLGYPSLLDPDEAHYAQLTREMLKAGSWLVPLLDGHPFIDKPILFHWLQGTVVRLIGESELALRLPSALAAVALIATIRWLASTLFDRKVGDWSALMFATLPATFALSSLGILDMVFAAFLFGGISCLLICTLRDRPGLELPGYLLVALAVMTKGPVALVLLVLFALIAVLSGSACRNAMLRLNWIVGITLIVLVASPWFVWMWLAYGDRFVQDYLVAGNLWYFTEPPVFSTRTTGYSFYLRIFAGGFFPWSLITTARAIDAIRAKRLGLEVAVEERMLWLWVVVVIGFFSIAQFRLDHYIFPAAPACCILAALGAQRAVTEWNWARRSIVAIAVCFVVGGAVAAGTLFQLDLGLTWTALALPVALITGGVALGLQMGRHHWSPQSLVSPLVALLMVYATVVLVGFPVLEKSRPTAALGRWISRQSERGSPIGLYRVEDWRASIRYYANAPVVSLESPEELKAFLQRWPRAFIVLLDTDDRAFRESGVDIAEVAARPAIVGRKGKYLRRQIWGKLVVARQRHQLRPL